MYIFDVKWSATTAGPSPFHNERTELFLLGCEKARSGNPCKGCFNTITWQRPENASYYTPEFCAENIIKHAPNKYITIGGGEPLDQIKELITMCSILKQHGFHILCYTWRDALKVLTGFYGEVFKQDFLNLLMLVDGFIDGEFILEKRCYRTDINDGLFNSIGSTNQHLIVKDKVDKNKILSYPVGDIEKIYFDEKEEMRICGRILEYGTF